MPIGNVAQVLRLVRSNIRGLKPYVGGAQIISYAEWAKLNQNESPYPPPPSVRAVGNKFNEPGFLNRYPPGDHKELKGRLAAHLGLAPEQITFGNGSDEVLQNVALVFLDKGDKLAYMKPDYSMWPVYEQLTGASPRIIDLPDDYTLPVDRVSAERPKLVFFSNPHTPSGTLTPIDDVRRLCEELFPNIIVEDEAYADFAEGNSLKLLEDCPNLIVTKTFSKAFALAGMRLGYGLGHPSVISQIDAIRLPYNINAATYAVGLAALEPESIEYYDGMIRLIKSERNRLRDSLENVGFSVRPSHANFVLAKTESPEMAEMLYHGLAKNNILVRYFSDERLVDCIRITVGTPEENDHLIAEIGELLG